jgi:cobalt-precorrin-7 (C5)-methyltransferase
MADIKIVSMGPGCINHLTWEAVQALYCADVMIGAKKYTEIYPEYGILVPEPLISGTIELIKENIDKKIAVLVTGDAGFYSLGKAVIKEFGCNGVTVIPGVSIVQFAFAKICEPWEDAQFISLHGRDEELPELTDKFMVLCDNKNTANVITHKLMHMISTHDIYAMEDLSMDGEKITYIKTEEDINSLNGSSLGVVIGIRR